MGEDREGPGELLLLAGPRDVAWVAAWARGFPEHDLWARSTVECMEESAAHEAGKPFQDVVLELPSSRWEDLKVYTEVCGGSWTQASRQGHQVVHVLALPDTPPPVLMGQVVSPPEGMWVAVMPVNIGWPLCWLRQHVERHPHHSPGEMIATLVEGLPPTDAALDRPLVIRVEQDCWVDLAAFMGRHHFVVAQLPHELRVDGQPVWTFLPAGNVVRLRDPEG